MRYAFHSWAYGSFPTWLPCFSLDETMRRINAAGYDAMELGCAAPHAWPGHLSPDRRREIRATADGMGLSIIALLPAPGGGPGHNPCSILSEERRHAIHHYKEVVDLACDLDAMMVLFVPGWRAYRMEREHAWDLSVRALDAIADHASQRGITVAVEPTSADSNLVDGAEDAVAMMRASGRSNVKVMLDTCHIMHRGERGSDYVRIMGRDLVHVHAADTGRSAPGDGTFDWVDLMSALKAQGYDGHVTVEAGFATRDIDPDDTAMRSLAFLRRIETSA